MTAKITTSQHEVLKALADRQAKVVDPRCRADGLNPGDFGGPRAASIARGLERKGYVAVNRLSDWHLRYLITTSGIQLLRYIEAGRPFLVSKRGAAK